MGNIRSFATGWRQVLACALLLAASGMIASTYSVVAVPLAREFQPSRTVLMLTMTVLSGTCAILAPLLGTLMDRVSVRRLMVVGGVLLAFGYAAISMATSFTQILIIFGVFIAPANVLIGPVAITVLLSRWFVAQRGRAIGLAIAGIAAGGLLFPNVIQALLDTHEWREALRLLAVVLAVWTIPAALLVIDTPEQRGLFPDGADTAPADTTSSTGAAGLSARAILTDPTFWLIAATVAIVTSGLKGMITNLAPLAIDNGIDESRAATLVSVFAGCGFIAKFVFAAICDKLGPRLIMLVSLTGFAAGMACLTQASGGYPVIALGVGLMGLFGGLMVPIESYIAPRVFGARGVGRAMGLLSGTILIALLATPPLFGLIFDLTGSYRGIFWTFAGLGMLALAWVPAIRLGPRDASPEPSAVPAE
ncbi:MFS transporter [Novosphingobium sp. PC22D]|uniref:MFS transporter n=1 Tax=Novosphingobium sp. PC22D TaxID=1962403 RepID=UPI000BEFA585|nr:MFS transporter [Novosphingobium sp. PC22D]PEQ11953.1 MFS transporter [Novosphingobium sp. PC22D]